MESHKRTRGQRNYDAIKALKNPALQDFIAQYAELCNPASLFFRTDSPSDTEYIRKKALENGEEIKLAIEGHTVHFDGYYDLGRDKGNTKILLPPNVNLGPHINSIDRDSSLKDIHSILANIMEGKEMYILFFCLGPVNSKFSIPAVQITDSAYVAHSESILYRNGYEEFKRLRGSGEFFKFVHSAGVLENGVCKNVANRKVYIDLNGNTVYSVNTQYGGNTIGLKKLAMRLVIQKASKEGWLTEHMLIMGIHGPAGRVTYFTGAFPSACGKTSTAMLKGETIVGDDIAYIRKIDGKIRAVNVERGIFGIIKDVNPENDPLIWKALTTPREVIFSNVLVKDDVPYWLGDNRSIPQSGINYSGEWTKGKKDKEGKDITHSHSNARYTIRLRELKNCDEKTDDPVGVEISGIIYGGRDSDTSVPVQQAFDWKHGILTMGAALESETTSATLGAEGVRQFNLMSNLDFLPITLGRYIEDNLKIVDAIKKPPLIFSVNYFLKNKEGKFITGMHDKRVWLKWMELRVHGDAGAISTPAGYIPEYEDLKRLFKGIFDKNYGEKDYIEQFTIRIPENLAKIERITEIYKKDVADTPRILFDTLHEQKKRLLASKAKFGDYIAPFSWTKP